MTRPMSPLEINAADAVAGMLTDRALAALNTLGQDNERGYRVALSDVWLRHPGLWCGSMWHTEALAVTFNLLDAATCKPVTKPSDPWHNLTDNQFCDLCAFFIQRVRHMEPTEPRSLTKAELIADLDRELNRMRPNV